jgi:hypothetical protein
VDKNQRHDEAQRPRQDHRCHVAVAEDLPVLYLDAGPVTGGRSALPPLTAGAMCVSRKMWRIALEDGGAMMTNKGLNPMCVWFPNGDTFVVAPEETLRLCDGCSFGVRYWTAVGADITMHRRALFTFWANGHDAIEHTPPSR